MNYNKTDALEYIFKTKFNEEDPKDEISFSRKDVRDAIIATGGHVPDNLNNFIKDLTRKGDSNPRSYTARSMGYSLKEGGHSEFMGVFFKPSLNSDGIISITCPSNLKTIKLKVSLPENIIDIVRTDEGGLLSVLSHTNILEVFFRYLPNGKNTSVFTVQIPVKVQPYEIDGLFLLVDGSGNRTPIACEAKSRGSDSLILSQIIGTTASALDRILEKDMEYVIPLGAKLLNDGTIFLVCFEKCGKLDKNKLNLLIKASTVKKMARYLIDPLPPKWVI